MASTNYVDNSLPAISAEWLNDVDNMVYDALQPSQFSSQGYGSLAAARTAYYATGVSDPNIGNNGNATSLAGCLFINNGFATTVSNADTDWKICCIKTVGETPDTTPQVSTDTRVNISSTVIARGAQHADAMRANLTNYSTDGNGCTAIYTHAQSDTGAMWSAATHAEFRMGGGTNIGVNVEAASYTTDGAMFGIVVHNSTATTAQTHPMTGLPAVLHPTATGIYILGNTNTDQKGGWAIGIRFGDYSMQDGGNCIYVEARDAISSIITSTTTTISATADIFLQGNSNHGIILNGTYTGSALRISDDSFIGLRTNDNVKLGYDTVLTQFELLSGTTEKFSVFMGASPHISLNGTQVVGIQNSGWTAMSGAADKSSAFDITTVTLPQLASRVNAIQAALTQHGLFA